MEGLLRPVGPEEERIYWIRRGLALVVLLVLIVGVGFMVSSIGNADEMPAATETEAVPPQAAPTPAAPPPPPPGVPDEVATEEAVPVPSSAATTAAVEEPLPPEPDNTFHQTPAPPAVPAPPAPAPPAAPGPAAPPVPPVPTVAAAIANTAGPCDPATTRISVAGPESLTLGTAAQIKISATNAGPADCVVIVDDRTFELTIANGGDQVFSSRDCVTDVLSQGAVLSPGRTLDWTLQWQGNRSEPQCRISPNKPASGTYLASAFWREAVPAHLNIQLQA